MLLIGRLFDTTESALSDSHDEMGNVCDQQKPGFYSEEDFISLAGSSPFKKWACGIVEKTRNFVCMSNENAKNPYFSEVFFQQILNRYLPILPLWGSLILPNETNLKQKSVYNTGETCKTQSTIENRFKILKQISLGDIKNRRLDDFSEELRTHTISIQRLVVKDTLKAPSYVKRKRSQSTLKEGWNKKQKPIPISPQTGIFQRPPSKTLQLSDIELPCNMQKEQGLTNVCPLDNLGSTCWFNSIMQAVSESSISETLQRHQSIIDVDQDAYNSLKSSLISLLKVMSKNKTTNTKAPKNQLRKILTDIAKYDGELGANLGQQQDANEFYLKIVSQLADDIGEQLGIKQTINCIDCQYSNSITEARVNSFVLTIPNNEGYVSIASLLKSYFEHEIREKCQQCSGLLYLQQKLSTLPSTLVLTVNRFQFNHVTSSTSKLHRRIKIDREIDLSSFVNEIPNYQYALKSVVCHHGRSVNSGHYTTNLIRDNSVLTVSDANVSVGSESEMEKNCYVLFYDRQVILPPSIKPTLECLSTTLANTVAASSLNQITVPDVYIPTLLKNGDISKAMSLLEKNVDSYNSNKYIDVFETTLQNIYGCDKEAYLKCNAHGFLFSKVQVNICKVCTNKMITMENKYCTLQPLTLSLSEIYNCFTASSNLCGNCQALDINSSDYFCSLPKTIILCPKESLKENAMPPLEFDLELCLQTVFPLVSKEYRLVVLIVQDKRGNVRIVKNEEKDDPDVGCTISTLGDFSNVTIMAPIYNIKQKSASITIMQKSKLNGHHLTPLRIPNKSFKDSLDKTKSSHEGLIPLEMAMSIAKESHWLSSDDINNYMRMVCLLAPDDVHYVDAGWFSHKVLREEASISSVFSLENSRYSWFTKSKVIIPVNLRNVHWVLIVIDIQGKVLYFCDSKGGSPGLILL